MATIRQRDVRAMTSRYRRWFLDGFRARFLSVEPNLEAANGWILDETVSRRH